MLIFILFRLPDVYKRQLVQGGGVSLNKEKLSAFDQVITTADLLDEKYLLVQRGKKEDYDKKDGCHSATIQKQ